MAQSVERLTLAQVMISQSVGLSHTLGSVLTAENLKPASDSASPLLMLCLSKINEHWGAWVAQSVERLTSAQVMISQSVGLNPTSDSVLTAQSLESASDSVSPSLSTPPLLMLSKINVKKNFFNKICVRIYANFVNKKKSLSVIKMTGQHNGFKRTIVNRRV